MRNIDIIQSRAAALSKKTIAKAPSEWADDLRQHLAVCEDMLTLVERENHLLRSAENLDLEQMVAQKRNLLLKLNMSLDRLRQLRARWQQLSPADKAQNAEVGTLIRQNQDVIMKVLVLDRENEQSLLRRGLVPPTQLPPAQRQNAHFVTNLYRRQGSQV